MFHNYHHVQYSYPVEHFQKKFIESFPMLLPFMYVASNMIQEACENE